MTKVLQERQDTIGKLMGDILADLSKASLDKVEKYEKGSRKHRWWCQPRDNLLQRSWYP